MLRQCAACDGEWIRHVHCNICNGHHHGSRAPHQCPRHPDPRVRKFAGKRLVKNAKKKVKQLKEQLRDLQRMLDEAELNLAEVTAFVGAKSPHMDSMEPCVWCGKDQHDTPHQENHCKQSNKPCPWCKGNRHPKLVDAQLCMRLNTHFPRVIGAIVLSYLAPAPAQP